MITPTPQTGGPHTDVVAAALEDWWITTDPVQPFEPRAVAESVEAHLVASGYAIVPVPGSPPMPNQHHTTCDASHTAGLAGGHLGPCILRHGHDGPVHQDARGATWWTDPTATPPTRRALILTTLLSVLCLAGGVLTAARESWGWATLCGIAWAIATWVAADAYAERRDHQERQQ